MKYMSTINIRVSILYLIRIWDLGFDFQHYETTTTTCSKGTKWFEFLYFIFLR